MTKKLLSILPINCEYRHGDELVVGLSSFYLNLLNKGEEFEDQQVYFEDGFGKVCKLFFKHETNLACRLQMLGEKPSDHDCDLRIKPAIVNNFTLMAQKPFHYDGDTSTGYISNIMVTTGISIKEMPLQSSEYPDAFLITQFEERWNKKAHALYP